MTDIEKIKVKEIKTWDKVELPKENGKVIRISNKNKKAKLIIPYIGDSTKYENNVLNNSSYFQARIGNNVIFTIINNGVINGTGKIILPQTAEVYS